MEINIEETILKKLNLTKRGAAFILNDKDLCNKILVSDPIWVEDFIKKYPINKNRLIALIKNELISSFSNSDNQGSKVFVFENESLKMLNGLKKTNSINEKIKEVFSLYYKIIEKQLSGIEWYILKEYYNCESIHDLSIHFNLSKTRVRQIKQRAERRVNRYFEKLPTYHKLIFELDNLEKQKKLLQHEINSYKKELESHNFKEEVGILLKEFMDLDVSVRLLNCLKSLDVGTIGDVLKKSKKELLTARNFGKKSMCELEELLEKYNLKLKIR